MYGNGFRNRILECKGCGEDISDKKGDSHCSDCKAEILKAKKAERMPL